LLGQAQPVNFTSLADTGQINALRGLRASVTHRVLVETRAKSRIGSSTGSKYSVFSFSVLPKRDSCKQTLC
jgi:hypothetical protein